MYRIPLTRPWLPAETLDEVGRVLASGFLTEGAATAELEAIARGVTGAAHVLAVTSCTTGLELALRALGVGTGHEVVVPAYTYPATATAVSMVGALPVVVDVDPWSMNVDFERLERAVTPATRALMPVSLFGNPLDWDRLAPLRARLGIPIIEDAACSLGASWRGQPVGSQADVTVFSLHPRKVATTGEGGLVTTNDEALAERMWSLKHFGLERQGPDGGRPRFVRMGTNLKLSNIQAAVGLPQLRSLEEIVARRRELAARYLELLEGLEGVDAHAVTPGGKSCRQTFCVFVPRRDEVMARMRARGVEAQIGTYLLPAEPAFQDPALCRLEGPFPGAQRAWDECLALPLYHEMTDGEQVEVVAALREALGEI
ncbi:DegT/DnrJ/EryC1/StrS family aminotransferase [Fundidesulfovibrio agrisoli]|uniref:DegT/DnrJ/EryC1/StrS family aminotransferase n=1 Tax=Fundidesulfovibrio agrisoli TaxID=2922717 RepID=UPI001FAD63C4|nr:DegT/DnrJ/EryC1/StrS family aminotransferase [Fundidesulfovibrio agrisoli]